MSLANFFLSLNAKYRIGFQFVHYSITASAIVAAVFWVLKIDSRYDAEASYYYLSGLVILLNQIHRSMLDAPLVSSIAKGYIDNHILPAVTQLKSKNENPIIYIYRPKLLDELSDDNIEIILANLRSNGYTIKKRDLGLRISRSRDLLQLIKEDKISYIDFPHTLKSLGPQISSKRLNKREKYERRLIDLFFKKICNRKNKDGCSWSENVHEFDYSLTSLE